MKKFRFLTTSVIENIPPKETKSYTRHGICVTQLVGHRLDRSKRYKECVVPPVLGWYPSKTANFVFRGKNFDPQYLIEMSAEHEWNPSIWLHRKSGRYVLRVPKDRENEVWKRLYRRGLWYDPATNVWNRRRKRSRRKGYPSFVQSLSIQAKIEKKFG